MDVTKLHYDKRIPNVSLHATAIAMTLEYLRIQSIWVQPLLVAQIEFTEWTIDNQLRQPVVLFSFHETS